MRNPAFFIAKRYLFSKKSNNVINIISGISVVGITVCTAALVIVLSAFNGIEDLVLGMANEYEPDIEVSFKKSKTFNTALFPKDKIQALDEVEHCSEVIEEVVMIKREENWVNAIVMGVEDDYLQRIGAEKALNDGRLMLKDEYGDLAIMGVRLMDKLGVFIPQYSDYQNVTVYFPVRNKKVKVNNMPLNQMNIQIGGALRLNNEKDLRYMFISKDLAADYFEYDQDITKLAVMVKEGNTLDDVAEKIRGVLGNDFEVKTVFQKNEIIYKTSRTEKWMVIFILGFIFLLALFNMVASISMLMLEKKKDIYILKSFGAPESMREKVFIINGLLINGIGLLMGLGLGYLICWAQIQFGLIRMDGFVEEVFPVVTRFSDFMVIFVMVLLLGSLASILPVKLFMRRTERFEFK